MEWDFHARRGISTACRMQKGIYIISAHSPLVLGSENVRLNMNMMDCLERRVTTCFPHLLRLACWRKWSWRVQLENSSFPLIALLLYAPRLSPLSALPSQIPIRKSEFRLNMEFLLAISVSTLLSTYPMHHFQVLYSMYVHTYVLHACAYMHVHYIKYVYKKIHILTLLSTEWHIPIRMLEKIF
jgi:hypothetical protein